ncbi:probable serine/threonine-protein kinase PBL11 isoform X2 [Ziziphus jujuba]|uniref:Probable serine/threonine-protein kinase PBL11 isoform X2 n=1 Tax=Ziziphus jujuba TaxID=326968 RepID=A0ABM3ZY50_ZIZJJ|nr:probable serine/threonine-protein kinase PBL11 isoform X2 [Ziziphus jujuba]
MGNCLKKLQLEDPNQPVAIPHPHADGVEGIVFQTKKIGKTSHHDRISSAFTEKHGKHESQRRSPLADRNSVGRKRRKNRRRGNQQTSRNWNSNGKKEVLHGYKSYCFCYSVLKAATQKFNSKNLLGQGGSADVYKGFLSYCNCTYTASKPNAGLAVAVKILRKKDPQGQEEWENEVKFLSKLNHPNIVQLIGYCCDGEHRILVYECMSRGSLEDHLLKEVERKLNWRTRINIAFGIAEGLAYIHARGKPIIHRDLKASNILLDANFKPKLSDFGLALYGPKGDVDHVSTRVLGTRGYFAPEYIGTGHLTLKVDVYSFGVVLLQILSGYGAVKKFTDGTTGNLVQWAEPRFSQLRIDSLVDEALGNNFPMEEARRFAELTQQCLHLDPQSRPTMAEVVTKLEQLQQNARGSCNQTSPPIARNQTPPTIATFSSCPPPSTKKLRSHAWRDTSYPTYC